MNYRVVIEESVLEQPSTLVELSSALDRAQQVRVVERVPTKLVVADRSIALLPLQSTAEAQASAEASALVVHAGGLVEALVGLFEGVWTTARPLLMSSTGEVVEEPMTEGPDETDLLILSLMLTGLTDRKVATRLDLSLRTMQRRVQRLAELAGVTTRMQAGVACVRAGLGEALKARRLYRDPGDWPPRGSGQRRPTARMISWLMPSPPSASAEAISETKPPALFFGGSSAAFQVPAAVRSSVTGFQVAPSS